VSLPKGGGAIHGIGEKFGANPVTGTGSMTVPVPTSPARSGFGPQLSLAYDSGAGNGPFGFGWTLSTPAIVRKTDKGLPRYHDLVESDVYVLSGAEDLVPLRQPDGSLADDITAPGFRIRRYRPRVDTLFARIERWTATTGETHWRSITRDNVTTVYGTSNESRIFDPADPDPAHPSRVFSWLISESFDDKGNAVEYHYKPEDSTGILNTATNEANRTASQRSANRHLKRIRYGNTVSRLDEARWPGTEWLFELVVDYGEHDPLNPTPGDTGKWLRRNDAFSSYRAGFEVRTYRLCQRFLMFHHFKNEPEVGADCLVRSLDLRYRARSGVASDTQLGHPVASFIQSVTAAGYRRNRAGGYMRRAMPPVEFTYSEAVVDDNVQTVDRASLENLPSGIDASYQWLDLFGEGVSGIFTEQADTWFYKPNLSPPPPPDADGRPAVRLGPVQHVGVRPNVSTVAAGVQLMDLTGDGQPDVVVLDGPLAGFFEIDEDEQWGPFRPFGSRPTISVADPNVRLVDLDGDGHADVLVTEDRVFTWYPSLAEDGFGAPIRVPQRSDEEAGPAVVFADGTQSIYLADMTGDGLTDLVRIRNGEVCYWPNVGYGRFGPKVTMDNSPWFESPDIFGQQRVRVADIDGSGTADIIYLDGAGVRLYFNQSGNAWSDPQRLRGFPAVDDLASVAAVDLFGNGTVCLVWSTPLPAGSGRQMRYVDLMGGQKPHLMLSAVNNLGAETRVQYASSAKFYLRDKQAGQPWVTKLPFPVHVVERVDTLDRISGNAFVTRYAYHHGYFDGHEREFRGFGIVEQWDTEQFAALADPTEPAPTNIDQASHVPPVHTKTWFHTGVYAGRNRISNYFAGLTGGDSGEYYREPGWRTDNPEAQKRLLDDTILPDTVLLADGTRGAHVLTADEEREACRALRGSMLRQEIYGLDGTPKAEHPYTVVEQNFTVELLQPRGANRHAVFFAHPRETLEYHYERNHDDPRVTHSLTLDVDPYGNVLRSASIGYGRRQPDPAIQDSGDRAEQTRLYITCAENGFTNPVTSSSVWRTPLPSEQRNYELTGLSLGFDDVRFKFEDVKNAIVTAAEISYEAHPSPAALEKRLIEHVRTRYRPDDLGAAQNDSLILLPLARLESLALPGESYKLAFTPGLIAAVYGSRVTDAMLEREGRYVHSDGDANWWIPAGRTFLSPGPTDTAAQELNFARQHFFLPHRYRDPFHSATRSTETVVGYDRYDLLLQDTCDALGNCVTVGERDTGGTRTLDGNDYRVLQPRLIMDPNRNRSAVAYDTLGMVVGTAVMGKPPPATVEGDTLDGFDRDLTEATVLSHLASPLVDPNGVLRRGDVLQRATTRLMYDLFAYQRTKTSVAPQPAVVFTLSRETHDSEPAPSSGLRVQPSFSYSDGFGREIQKKIQGEPGRVPTRDGAGRIIVGVDGQPALTPNDVSPRWVGSGWTVFNNKGKPVRQFEPFFTDTHHFEADVRVGVSPVLFYDPPGRVVATLYPDHTWGKVVVGPWRQDTWDGSDTVLVADPKADPDVGEFFTRIPSADYLPTWHSQRDGGALGNEEQRAARKSAVHAATPTVVHADSLGRAFLTIAHNKAKYSDTAQADPPVEEFHRTRVVYDTEGNEREVVDAKDRVIMRYEYNMLGGRAHQASMEAGARWMLTDVASKPLYTWDSRDHRFRTSYDPLRRPTDSFLREGAAVEVVVERTLYGDGRPNAEADNLRGRVVQAFDQAGVATTDAYDFKGNGLRSRRQFAQAYSSTLDWSAAVPLNESIYTSRTRHDALNRPVQMIAPHSDQPGGTVNIVQPIYNEANLLEQLHVWLNQTAEPVGILASTTATLHAVTNVDYDAKGQRTQIDLGNGARTAYTFDSLTFRLKKLVTRRGSVALQDLRYTYDPQGNITHIGDNAQQTIFFSNRRVEPSANYVYDALYRLIEATGREHLGQAGAAPQPPSYDDAPWVRISLAASDGLAMGRYLERYVYDVVGNVDTMRHVGTNPASPGWTRTYSYGEPSLIEGAKQSNRLTGTAIDPMNPETYSVGGNGYDEHGNMLRLPHLQVVQWGFKDELRMSQRQAVNAADDDGSLHQGERTWYVYDASGQRVRKVTEFATGGAKDERLYLGGFEIFRRDGGSARVPMIRETLHVMDDKQRVALVETRTMGEDRSPRRLVRYQLANHLGSAMLELDDQARILSYEEYTPFGSSSYEAMVGQIEAKRYRFTGKERDEESGLYYHGARYYAPWLARWTAADPAGLVDGTNRYSYARGNPVIRVDPSGTQSRSITLEGEVKLVNKKTGKLETVQKTREIVVLPATPEGKSTADQPPLASAPSGGDAKPPERLSEEALRESVPLFSFFFKVPTQYVRPHQAPPQGAPVGLAAIRQLNGQPAIGVANFARDYAPGTSVENLTSLTVQALAGGVGAASAASRLAQASGPARLAASVAADAPAAASPAVKSAENAIPAAERGEQLFNDLGDKLVKNPTEESAKWLRGRLTISIVEPRGGDGARIITVQDAKAYKLLQSGAVKLLPNEVLGPAPVVLKEGEAWLIPAGKVHSEILGVWNATALGAEGGEVFTTNPACRASCDPLFKSLPNWTHLNPQR